MWQLAAAFAEVALRRRGPETIPDSSFLVLGLLAADMLVTVLYLALPDGLSAMDFALLTADIALFFPFVYAVLAFFKLERRYRQTVSAILGADICITLAYLPFEVAGLVLRVNIESPPFSWLWAGFFFWSAFITASVLARSLSQPLIVGLMFELLFILTSLSIRDFLTPAAS
jgi:hypothetical protein